MDKFPPRLMGAQIPGSQAWAAMSDMAPPDYASFEFLSLREHQSLLGEAVQRERQKAFEEAASMAMRCDSEYLFEALMNKARPAHAAPAAKEPKGG